ncbi:MAG: choice-of-anchor D domain-containing protein [Bdellovibrionaceae bacterium]|nr:choice-of-anchor D domain-containing protein [Pseudobdellovibrionaceae bacterium]
MDLGYLDISQNPLYDFTTHPIGSSIDFVFTVTNTGTGSATGVTGTGLLAPFRFKGGSYPGVGGNCGATFTPSQACSIVVNFSPTVAGVFFDTIQLDYNDGSNPQNSLRDIKGTGIAAASLEISNAPLYDYGTQALSTVTDYTFTVSNTGGISASAMAGSGLAAPFLFKGGSYPGTGGTCSASLIAAGTCTIVVSFNPTATGIFSDSIQIDYNDGVSVLNTTRNIQGTGTNQAVINISEGPLFDYGTKAIGSVNDQVFTLNNSGGLTATGMTGTGLASPFSFKGGSYPGIGGNCLATLASAASCTVVVTYSPVSTGVQSDSIEINYNDGSTAQTSTRIIQGSGATSANLIISDGPTFDFGTKAVSTQTDQIFTIDNIGGVDATVLTGLPISAPFGFKGGSFPGTGGNCTATLASSNTCTIVITYAPATTGIHNSTIQISYNDGSTAQVATRDVTGTGATAALLTISDGPLYDYGSQAIGSNTDKTFTVQNTGGLTATVMTDLGIAAPFSFKGGGYPGTGGTCGASLASTATCSIVVRYSPTVGGSHSDAIEISYNDGLIVKTVTRDVQGLAANSAFLAISDGPTYDYGNKAVGSTTEKTFTIQNTGSITATAINGNGLAVPFNFKGGSYPGSGGNCGSTLNAAASCTVVINFSPLTSGAKSDTLIMDYNDGVAATSATRDLVGTASTAALLAISDGPTFDYGIKAVGSNTDKTFTVQNNGGVSATLMDGGILTTPFNYAGGTYPGTAGTCGVTLAATATCTIVVKYSPVTIGLHSDILTVDYDDGTGLQQATRNIQGTGANAAFLAISNGPIFDFGTKALSSNTDQIFNVNNTGGLTATTITGLGLTAPFSFKGGAYPGTGGNCGVNLATAGSCTIVVTYSPTTTGPHSDSIQLDYDNGITTDTSYRDVQGTGANAALITISDAPTYNYGTLAISSNADHVFTLTNSGGVTASAMVASGLAAPYTFKDGTYPGTGGTCAGSLNASASCTVVVKFSPVTTGTHNDTLLIDYNDGIAAAQSSVDVTGLGTSVALLEISEAPLYDFGNLPIGQSAEYTFSVTNNGGINATSLAGTGLAAPFNFKGGSYPGAGGTCSSNLAASASCTIIVKYSPTLIGLHQDSIQIDYDNGSGLQSSMRDIQGTGVSAAFLTISDGPLYDYGPVAITGVGEHKFTITNSGNTSASSMVAQALTLPFNYKGGTYPGIGGTCAASLNASTACDIVVTFNPTSTGNHTDTIQINYNNGVSGQSSLRNVQGTGANPAVLSISDGPIYNFGTQSTGSSTDHSFTITNTGGVPASTILPSAMLNPYNYKGGSFPGTGGTCGSVLNNGLSCSVVVTYAPVVIGTHNITFDLNYYDGVTIQVSSRDITGEGATLANLEISDGPTFDYGLQATGSATDHIFTVSNTGGIGATAINPVALTPSYRYKGGSYPGAGGDCNTTLSAAATCNIVVVFAPAIDGTHNDTLRLDYNDGSNAKSTTRALTGQSASPANLTISDGPTFNYGVAANGSAVDHTFIVQNSGGVSSSGMAGSGLAAPFDFKDGNYPGTGGTCSAALAPATSCTVVVTYAPTVTGLQSDILLVDYNDGVINKSATRNLQGTSTSPAILTISETDPYSFGSRAIGSNTTHSFTITNIGGVIATSLSGSGLALPFSFAGGSFPGVGGTCTSTLANSGACTVVLNFSPSVPGLQNDTLEINYNNGVGMQMVTRDVEGTASSSALLVVSDGPTYDFGVNALGSVAEYTFTVQNTGDVSATAIVDTAALAAPFAYKGGSYPGIGGTCSNFINSLATCTIVLTYSPVTSGNHSDSVVISYFDGVITKNTSRDLQGVGADPASISISDGPSYSYGNVAIGGNKDKIFTLTNNGGVPATSMAGSGLALPFRFKGGGYPGTGGDCGATLASGASCNVVVAFLPTAAGNFTDSILIDYNDGVAVQQASRDIDGDGLLSAFLAISDGPTYDFGILAVGSSAEKTFTVQNTGGLQATAMNGTGLAAPFAFKGPGYPGTGGTCSATLNSGASCTIVVRFAPLAINVFSDSIQMDYNNGLGATNAFRDIQGSADSPAVIDISDSPTYNYGTITVGGSAEHSFTLTNNGGIAASSIVASGLAAPYTFKGGTYPGTGGTCTGTLAASATCSIIVSFNPTISGTHNDTLNVNYNDGLAPQLSARDITGASGTPAILEIGNAPEYDFGTKALGSTNDHTFSVDNTGGSDANSVAGAGLAAPFNFKGGSYPGIGGTCTATITASSTCTIVVTYSPSTSALHTDTIDLNYNDGVAAQTANRDVKGTGASAAYISISEVDPYDYGVQATGSSTDKIFTLTNTGSLASSVMTGTGLAAPFSYKGPGYPGTGGTCASGLAPTASCTIVVTYAPVTTGAHNDTIEITYNNGLIAAQSDRIVQGTGANPAVLAFTEAPLYDYGTKGVGSTTDHTFTIQNSGGVPSTLMADAGGLAAPFNYKGGTYPGFGGNCGVTIPAAGSCTIVLTYAPVATGLHSDTLIVDYHNGISTQQVNINLQGTGANLAFLTISDGPSFDYGTVAIGFTAEHTFTITNTGGVASTAMAGTGLIAPYQFKSGTYPGAGGNCNSTLAASGTCTIVVTYTPTASGVHNDTIQIDYNDGSIASSALGDVTGAGANSALLTISDGPTFDYGVNAVGSSVDHTFTINNIGGVTATGLADAGALAAPFNYKDGSYPGTGGSCGSSLNNGLQCTIIVTYTPTATGSHSDAIQLNYNNGVTSTNVQRNIQGTATNPALLILSETDPYNFGNKALGSTTEYTFTISNTGGVPATAMAGAGLASPFEYKDGSYPGTGGSCGLTVNNGGNCTIIVTYTPATAAVHNDTIEINYNDGAAVAQATRNITGTGTSSAYLEISDSPTYDYQDRAVGSVTEKTFSINNTGSVTATAISGGGLTLPFRYKGGSFPGIGGNCGATLAAAGTCDFVVEYAPTASGAHVNTIDISYSNGASTQHAFRNIQGLGVNPAFLAISNSPNYNWGNRAVGSVNEFTLTIDNTGGFAASGITGSGLASPFAFKGGSYPGFGGTCGAGLSAGGNCTIIVTYSPLATGAHSDTIVIDYNDGVALQQATRDLLGSGVIAAFLDISDATSYNFGVKARGSVSTHTFVVTNTGGAAATSIALASALAAPFTFNGGPYPGVGGDCSATLGIGATCNIVVRFSPTANGLFTDSLDLNYNNGSGAVLAQRDMEGTGADPALLVVDQGPTYNFGTITVGASVNHIFVVENQGGVPATVMSGSGLVAPYLFSGGYPGAGGNCGVSLAAGATCQIEVNFNPSITGTFNDTVIVGYNDGAAVQQATRDLTAIASTPAILDISNSPSYNFGIKPLGSVNDFSFTVTNNGGSPATSIAGVGLAAPFAYKDGTYPGTGGSCGTTINNGDNCTVIVSFSPTAAGVVSDTIQLDYNDGLIVKSALRDVNGEGANAGFLTISDSPFYDFGTKAIGSINEYTFVITNTGALSTSAMAGSGLAAPYSFKGPGYPGTGGTCSSALAPSGTCTIVVRYAPTIVGFHGDAILIDYNDGLVAQQLQRNIQGTGVNPADLVISEIDPFDYGTKGVGSVNDYTFTITNNGEVPATAMANVGLVAPFSFKGGPYPGIGGNCGVSLAASAVCTMVVTYAPTATGFHSNTIQINYNNGAAAVNTQRQIQGTGANLAFLTITDGPTFNFGTQAHGSNTDKTFTVQNTGGVAATAMAGSGLAVPYSFKGGSYPGIGGNCNATLATSATCTIVVTFSPVADGTFNDSIQIDYNDGDTVTSVLRNVTGVGAAPAFLTITDGPTYNYGIKAVGSNTDKTFTVENTGGVQATLLANVAFSGPFTFKDGPYPGTGGDCGGSLNAGLTCTIVVTYSPVATGSHSDNIKLNYNDGTIVPAQVTRAIAGTATTPALIDISDGPEYDFGSKALGSTTEYTLTLTNNGGAQATAMAGGGLAAPFEFKGGSYPGLGATCSPTLASGNSCTIIVTYSPSTVATHNDMIEINYNNGAALTQSTRNVKGTGSPTAFLTISDTPTWDFASQPLGALVEHTFTITNTGSLTATALSAYGLALPYRFKNGLYPGTGGTCNTSLVASNACTIIVEYLPTSTGVHNDTLNIDYNNGAVLATASVNITGNGVNPAVIDISNSPTYNFGNQATGSSVDATLTLTNNGGYAASGMAGSGLAAPFIFKGGTYPGGGTCGTSLGVGLNCTVIITYSPSTVATHNDTVLIDYFDGAGSQQSTRDITGTGVVAAFLEIADGPTFDFGTVARNSSTDHLFVVTNTGGAAASAITGGVIPAPFSFKGGPYPGIGGNCGASLGIGGSCNIVVKYNPTANGVHSENVTLNYNDGSGAAIATRNVQGIAADPALLDITDGPTYNFNSVVVSAVAEHTFSITNNGGVPATGIFGSGLANPYTFKGGSYPGGGTCGVSINASATCTVIVEFAPLATGVRNDTMVINYNDGLSAVNSTRDITGTGMNPAFITISEIDPYNYGDQAVGSTTEHTFTLTNTGGTQATVMSGGGLASPFAFKGGAYPGGGTCGPTLNTSTACTIIVTFTPNSMGVKSDQIIISYNDGGSVQQTLRTVTGTGVGAAQLTITDGPIYNYNLQATGSSTDHTFIVENIGSINASSMVGTGLAAPFSFKGGPYPGIGGTCNTDLAAGLTCTIVVTYAPTVVNTGDVDSIIIQFNDGALPQSSSRNVTGDAALPAVLSITGTPHNFGTKGVTSVNDQSFTLQNTGGVPATTVSEVGLNSPFSIKNITWPGIGGNCGTSIPAGSSCTFVVSFSPSATGPFSDTIDLSYNDGATSQNITGNVSGTGAPLASLVISDATTFDFGTKAVSSVTEHTFNIDNVGGVAASGITGSGLATPFRFKGGSFPGIGGDCLATLNASSSCTMVVEFAPISQGPFADTIQVDYNDSVNAQTSTRAVSGTGASSAVLTISEANPYNFGSHAVGSVTEHTFIVTNSGGVAADSIVAQPIALPFRYKNGIYPGTGGTCSGTLPATVGNTCTLIVEFAPTASGTPSSTIQLDYYNGASNQSATRDIQGTATTPGVLIISDGATYNFGTFAVLSSTPHTFTITNTGQTSVTSIAEQGLSLPFEYLDGSFPGTGGTCTATLPAVTSNTCTIVVSFKPTSVGSFGDTLQLNYYDGANNQSVTRPMTGNGGAAATLEISDSPDFNYGTLAVGSNTDHTFTISNTGAVQATALTPQAFGTGVFNFKGGSYPGGGSCGSTLSASTACTVIVTYSPVATVLSSDTLQMTYNDGVTGQTAARNISGTGATAANITITESDPYNYGTVPLNSPRDHLFTLQNTGAVSATSLGGSGLAAPFTFAGGSFPGVGGGNCTSSLAAGASCDIVVRFLPTTTGIKNDTIQINYYNGASAANTLRDVTGNAVANALLVVSNNPSYSFGTVARSSVNEYTFTVTNTGGYDATSVSSANFSAPYTYKGGTFPGIGGDCGTTIPTAAPPCNVVVVYSPTANGTHNATMTIDYNNGASVVNATRSITGTAANPALLTFSSGTTYDYGTKALASDTPYSFTLTNSGGVPATGLAEVGLAAPYNFTGNVYPGTGGTCLTTTINAGQSCTVLISFKPTATGSTSDTIDFSYNDGTAVGKNVTRGVTGTGANQALLSWDDGSSYDFGATPVGTTLSYIFNITNSGGVQATGLNLSLSTVFRYVGGSYPGFGGSCSTTLGATLSCQVAIEFAPNAPTTFNDTFNFNYNNGATVTSADIDLLGEGEALAVLTISDNPLYDFGLVANNSVNEFTFTVSNVGTVAATNLSGDALTSFYNYKGGTFPGIGGTCTNGGTLGASPATCTVVVEYAPTSVGLHSTTLKVNYNNSVTAKVVNRAIVGTAAAEGVLAYNPYNYGSVARGSVTPLQIVITNTGGVPVTGISSVFSGTFRYVGGAYPGTGTPSGYGLCGLTLNVAAACAVLIEFAPTVNGFDSSTLNIDYNDGANSQTASALYTGTAVNPALLNIDVAPEFDFGSKPTSSTTTQTIYITNNGQVTASSITGIGLSSPFGYGGSGFFPGGGSCLATLAPSNTCTVVVKFSPTVDGSYFNPAFAIRYNNGVATVNSGLQLRGVGVGPANLEYRSNLSTTITSYNFGTVAVGATDAYVNIYLYNTGSTAASSIAVNSLPAPFKFYGGSYPGGGGATCGTDINSVSNTPNYCIITLQYDPTVVGVSNQSLVMDYYDGVTNKQATIPLTGTAANPALLTISDSDPYSYGTYQVGASPNHLFTLTNTGGVSAAFYPITLNPPYQFVGGSFPGDGGNCGATLAGSNATCTLDIAFVPTAAGIFSDTITVGYDDGVFGNLVQRSVTGTATSPAILTISLSEPYNFGPKTLNSQNEVYFLITNNGSVNATSMGGVPLSSTFTWANGSYPGNGNCTNLLGNGQSCQVSVIFTPNAAGSFSDTMTINYHDSAQMQTANKTLQGSAMSSSYCVGKTTGSPYAGGSGTVGTPYTICTTQQFLNITSNLGSYFELRDDLDFNGITFTPVGSSGSPFTGNFNGKNYDIRNVTYNNKGTSGVGLFGYSSGSISNVQMITPNITGGNHTGGIVGNMTGGTLNYSRVSGGTVSSTNTNTANGVGGAVGTAAGTLTEISSSANISGNYNVGGLVGYSTATISKSYATGTVNGINSKAGGFAGYHNTGTLSDSFASGAVTGSDKVGGFIGENAGTITRAHSNGSVSGSTNVGGFAGSSSGSDSSSFWNTSNSGQGSSAGSASGLNNTDMKDYVSFTTWNFNGVWKMEGSYPLLSLFTSAELTVPASFVKNETFEGAGTVETWGSSVVTASNIYDVDSTGFISDSSPSWWGTQSLNVNTIFGNAPDDAYNTLALSPARNHTWTSFDVAVTSVNVSSGDVSLMTATNTAGTSVAWEVIIQNTGAGVFQFRFDVYHDGLVHSYNWPSGGNGLSLNQIYRMEINWDINKDFWEVRVNKASKFNGVLSSSGATLNIGQIIAGSSLGISSNAKYELDNLKVSIPLTPANMTQDVESIITLTSSGTPDSCSIQNPRNVTVTKPCSCTGGSCTVGVTGFSGYIGSGRFDYTVKKDGKTSNSSAVELNIL